MIPICCNRRNTRSKTPFFAQRFIRTYITCQSPYSLGKLLLAAYLEQIQDIPPEKIAYVDECGIDTYLYRKYGYAVRGQPVFGHIRGRKYKRCGIVAAKTADKILAPLQYSGTMDSALFELWFSNQLLPSLNKGTIIVMDNASFHSRKRLVCVAQNAECRLLFLPPYSPELNPLKISGPGSNVSYEKFFLMSHLLTMRFLLLFNCGDYII